MKITRLAISQVLGIREFDLRPSKPVVVITANNKQGKTSIVNALALALAYQLPRIDKQKDAGAILHDGAKAGTVDVFTDTYKEPFLANVTDGKISWKNPAGEEGPRYIEYVLNPPLFASQSVAERRSALFRLLGLDLTPDGIKSRLIARECDAKKVEDMAPMLRAGFESAAKHAAAQATMAKGAFKATTGGEAWGSSKGATWRAPTPAFSGEQAAELHAIDGSIVDTEAELADANKRLGEAQYAKQTMDAYVTNVEKLRALVAGLGEHTKLAEKATTDLAELETELQQVREKAGMAPQAKPKLLPCPDCGAALCMDASGLLAQYPTLVEDPAYDPDAASSIPAIEKAIGVQRNVLARHATNKVNAESAKTNLDMLEKNPPPKGDDPAIIRETVDTLKTSIATKRKRQAELQDAQRKLDESDGKTKAARQHHTDVLAWDLIAKALAPDGIQAEILNEALGPMNDRLALSCGDTQWPLVVLAEDMSISYGGRPYVLCSESERYRVDAVIAESISFLSGLKFVCLDRSDLLDTNGWLQLLKWMDTLAYERDIETAIVLATTDWEPSDLTDLMQSVRIEAGEIVRPEQREAA